MSVAEVIIAGTAARRSVLDARMGSMTETTRESAYTTRPLTPDTWGDFAKLVEANNGVWGGCWCMGFHPEGCRDRTAGENREAKAAHVRWGTVHQILVYSGDDCVGWCQY